MSDQVAEAVFDALGEPVRRRILELLHHGPTPVGWLAERLPVGRPAVSKHLRVLSNAGLIEHRSVGTRNLYLLAPEIGPAPVGWRAERLPVGRPAVSKHLRVLSNAGLIEHRSVGTRNLYLLAPGGMAIAQRWLVQIWDAALATYAAEASQAAV